MPRVVPSQVVAMIEVSFPEAIREGGGHPGLIDNASVRGLLALISMIPDELMPHRPGDFAQLITCREALRASAEELWPQRNPTASERNALRTIRRVLQLCQDEAASADTREPAFITDIELRADIHRDFGEVNRALQNGEWKAATVLAGSIVEALLLWALQARKPAEVTAAEQFYRKQIDEWVLSQFIEQAHTHSLISDETRVTAGQAREFRNLIHPGRAARLAQRCDRATALVAVGAVEAVMRVLS